MDMITFKKVGYNTLLDVLVKEYFDKIEEAKQNSGEAELRMSVDGIEYEDPGYYYQLLINSDTGAVYGCVRSAVVEIPGIDGLSEGFKFLEMERLHLREVDNGEAYAADTINYTETYYYSNMNKAAYVVNHITLGIDHDGFYIYNIEDRTINLVLSDTDGKQTGIVRAYMTENGDVLNLMTVPARTTEAFTRSDLSVNLKSGEVANARRLDK